MEKAERFILMIATFKCFENKIEHIYASRNKSLFANSSKYLFTGGFILSFRVRTTLKSSKHASSSKKHFFPEFISNAKQKMEW